MHNRARLITACFLVKDLHIDWRRGERYFMRYLLDGDEANNNGNWQWIASVGVDPAPLHRRLYNPVLQQRRHDPHGEYVRRWVPELDDVPDKHLATPREIDAYIDPIVDHAVERERTLADWAARSVTPRRWRASRSSREGRSARVRRAFIAGWPPGRADTTDDAVRLQFLVDDYSGPARVGSVEADNEPRAIAQAARILSLDHDGTAYPDVGERDPLAGALQRASGYLRPVLFHSPYEAAAWSILSARTSHAQAVRFRDALGETFPAPRDLLRRQALEGLPANKLARLHAIAQAALEGRLDREPLLAQTPTRPLRSCRNWRGSARSMRD